MRTFAMPLAIVLMGICLWCAPPVHALAPVTALRAESRDGQVFLTWQEADSPTGATFNVYVSQRPIESVATARQVGHHVEAHSARDWWEDPASFSKGKPSAAPVGFLIAAGGNRLDPRGGLFVHTPESPASTELHFAVTCSDASGKEDTVLAAGKNVLADPVRTAPGPLRPIWQTAKAEPAVGAGQGKALWLNLHAKGGVVPDMEYLVFGDATMGWREGLAFKFSVRVAGDEVTVRPTDRAWINRPHAEASDGGTQAIWTFWYGYNSKIHDRTAMAQGVPTNYTERRNLWILDWVRTRYQPDMHRVYCSGSSMGGCGTISFGLRHPELFAGLHAHVPIVAYTYLGRGSAARLEPSCWVGKIADTLKTNEGVGLLDRMDGIQFVRRTQDDLPQVYLVNGRNDGSIPWQNNPAFYRALNDTHQAFAAYWDTGTHSTCGKDAPADVKDWLQQFRRARRDRSYPAFSNTSTNCNPGDGRPEDGDPVGWMNRGMGYDRIEDQADHYAITVTADYPGIKYPVRTDVTLRRLQQFQPAAGGKLAAEVDGRPLPGVTCDPQGRITIPGVEIASKTGARITIQRAGR